MNEVKGIREAMAKGGPILTISEREEISGM
jgi:hypothetical protein